MSNFTHNLCMGIAKLLCMAITFAAIFGTAIFSHHAMYDKVDNYWFYSKCITHNASFVEVLLPKIFTVDERTFETYHIIGPIGVNGTDPMGYTVRPRLFQKIQTTPPALYMRRDQNFTCFTSYLKNEFRLSKPDLDKSAFFRNTSGALVAGVLMGICVFLLGFCCLFCTIP